MPRARLTSTSRRCRKGNNFRDAAGDSVKQRFGVFDKRAGITRAFADPRRGCRKVSSCILPASAFGSGPASVCGIQRLLEQRVYRTHGFQRIDDIAAFFLSALWLPSPALSLAIVLMSSMASAASSIISLASIIFNGAQQFIPNRSLTSGSSSTSRQRFTGGDGGQQRSSSDRRCVLL